MSDKLMNGCSAHLSEYDRAVLSRIFSPHLPDADVDSADEDQSCDEHIFDKDENELTLQIKQLEFEGVTAADKGDFAAAELLFTQVINLAPNGASGYNNRAQARRLLDNIADAESDLDRAVELSEGKGAAACQAFNQRALIRNLKGDENGALTDFRQAARLGSEFAKTQVIAMNPYSAMCSAMMTEMIAKVRRGEMEG